MRSVRPGTAAAALLLLTVASEGADVSALPQRFGFGLANGPWDTPWLDDSGAPWDYRYQYLSGSVTGNNWAKWNTPDGTFALWYLQESEDHGDITVFDYYMIVGTDPVGEDYTAKLPNAWIMWHYYDNWKLLMQKCAEFGGTVIVHHEPDLWGFIQSRDGDDPASCYAAVAASGFAETAAATASPTPRP